MICAKNAAADLAVARCESVGTRLTTITTIITRTRTAIHMTTDIPTRRSSWT